jgi:ribose transport system substrate-binding protein
MRRRGLLALCTLLVVGLMLAACPCSVVAGEKPLRIGVTTPSADHGWMGGVIWWAKKAISDWQNKDKSLTFFMVTAESAAKQVADVEDLMAKKIDALVILPQDSASLTAVVEEAHNKGIYVVLVGRGLTKDVYDVEIIGDNPNMGRVSGEWMAAELKGKGDLVIIEGVPTIPNTERVDGFKNVIKKYPGIRILDSQPGYWNMQKAAEVMENYLQKYPKIDAVWAGDDDMLKGALKVYKESRRKDIKTFLGGAGSKDIIKMVMDGDELVRADVTYTPSHIASGVSLAVMGLRGEGLGNFYQRKLPHKIMLSSELVTRENAKLYYFPDAIY